MLNFAVRIFFVSKECYQTGDSTAGITNNLSPKLQNVKSVEQNYDTWRPRYLQTHFLSPSELRSIEAFINSIILQTRELRYPVILLLRNGVYPIPDTTDVRKLIDLTSSLHVAVRLFSDRSKVRSKCDKKTENSGTQGDGRVCQGCSYHN